MAHSTLNKAMKLRDILTEPLFELVRGVAVKRSYEDGELIQIRGDKTRGLVIIENGNALGGNTGKDGSFISHYRFEPGDTFGEFTVFAGLPRTHDLIAVGDVEIDYVSDKQLKRLCAEYSDIPMCFLQAVTLRLHYAMEALDDAMRLPVTVRTAKLLKHLSNQSNKTLVISVKHVELADALGVTRVAIGNALKVLKDERLVRQGHSQIEICDRQRLDLWIDEKQLLGKIPR